MSLDHLFQAMSDAVDSGAADEVVRISKLEDCLGYEWLVISRRHGVQTHRVGTTFTLLGARFNVWRARRRAAS
jgi:hypothetical protein